MFNSLKKIFTMKENVFDVKKIPADYAFCFNEQCPMYERCVHYVAAQHAPANRPFGPAVYPWALRDGQCEMFRKCKPVLMAWGFEHLYDHLPSHVASAARSSVQRYFSMGVSTYYRYHHGERKLNPQQQEDVVAIVKRYGNNLEPRFDHYTLEYDFT